MPDAARNGLCADAQMRSADERAVGKQAEGRYNHAEVAL
jgi:hypothetical protein